MGTPFISDYLAAGLSADQPADPVADPGTSEEMIVFRYNTDTEVLVLYDPVAAAWVTVQTGATVGLTEEQVQDAVAALIQDGTGITWAYDDVLETLTPTVTITQYTDELAQDAVGAMVDASLTYVDATPLLQRAALTGDVQAAAGSNATKITRVVQIPVSDPNGDAITTGDGKAYFRVNSLLNGFDLIAVAAALTTSSSSGVPTVQIHNLTQAADMLTTKLTIDESETDSKDATAAAVIDAGNDDVATGDMLRIDIDVAGTGAKGLIVELTFKAP